MAFAASGCARFDEVRLLEERPAGPVQRLVMPRGKGFAVRGERKGAEVIAHVDAVERCADVERRTVDVRVRTVRKPAGASLTLEWIFGGALTALGGTVIAINISNPPDPNVQPKTQASGFVAGGLLAGAGVALLVGAALDAHAVGETIEASRRRTVDKEGLRRICNHAPASGAHVRLTLPDDTSLEAVSGQDGIAHFALPAGLDPKLDSLGRRATLDVRGDPLAQGRFDL